jgi:hypothetical protein
MPCSHVFEFEKLVCDYVYECVTTLRLSSECPCTGAKALPTRGYPGHDALLPTFTVFQKKILTTMLRPTARVKGFLDRNSILQEVGATACMGRDVAARSKLLTPTPPRLRCEDLRAQLESSGLRPTSSQKRSGDRLDSGSKATSKTKPRKVTSRTSRALGGCKRVVTLNS